MARHRPNGHAVPYEGADGWWHCHVTVGTKPDGKPDRKHVRRRTEKACADAVDELRRKARSGERVVAKAPTVAEWLDHWLETIVKPNRRWKTYEAYSAIVRLHLVPRIGRWRIGGTRKLLQPEHLEACYADLGRPRAEGGAGLSRSYVLQCHRVLSRALKVAVRRGRANLNVCEYAEKPAAQRRKPKPLSMEAVKKIITVVIDDRLAARWLIALLLGLRQGEVLGLRWGDLDLDAEKPTLRRELQAQRRTWRHGCADPEQCARWQHGCRPSSRCGLESWRCPQRKQRCRTEACPPGWAHGCSEPDVCKRNPRWCPERQPHPCRRHTGQAGCPPPCRPGCTGHARSCPQRVGGGIVLTDLKTEKSENTLPLDPFSAQALREHRRRQLKERMARGQGKLTDADLVFVSELGKAIDPRRDHEEWERVLQRAGLPDAALHAARHTAATLLLASGTDIAVVQEVLGHTDVRTTRGYTDVAAELKREAVDRLANLLFGGSLDALVQQSGATGRPR